MVLETSAFLVTFVRRCFQLQICSPFTSVYIRTTGLLNVHNVEKDTNTKKTSKHIAVDSHVVSSYKTVKKWIHERLRYEETFNVPGSDSRSAKSWPLRFWKKQEAAQVRPTSDTSILSASYEPRHMMVQVLGSTNKACVVCKWDGVKTATGLPTKSYYRCEACDACLCRPQIRNCFERYHKHMNIDIADMIP